MFDEQVVLITGAAQGIGAEVAREFSEERATIVIVDYNEETAKQVADELENAVVYQADVADFDRAHEIVDDVVEKFGRIDVLINNAGITQDASFKNMTKDQWDAVININLTGTFNYSKAVFQHMTNAGYGRIVSASSVVGFFGNFGQANYNASKMGIVGLTKTIAKEGASKGITANAIAPGFIETPMTDAMPEENKRMVIEHSIPVKRAGIPADVANAYKFLASKDSSYITGQVLFVSGGIDLL